ncbi:unnamed protein product [Porites lobata]|uniref:Death domain-containing protein n=1 Tax=Porites lobata TaxID=104759 RepID=A0ABN8QB32_9CNID|nr:unnamed protein product [Porites lobata]
MTRLIRKPRRPASFFAYFRPDFPEILRLICCHTQLTHAVIQDLENRDVIYADGSSKQDMIPGEDKAFVFVSGGICPFDDEDVDDVYLRLLEDEFKTELRVRVVKYEDPAKIEFHNTLTTTGRKSLLCKFHLPIQNVPLAARHGLMELAQQPEIKDGTPTQDELEGLSRKISDKWKKLGRRLQFDEAQITDHDKKDNELSEKAYYLLMAWKSRDASNATYRVLHKALSDVELLTLFSDLSRKNWKKLNRPARLSNEFESYRSCKRTWWF